MTTSARVLAPILVLVLLVVVFGGLYGVSLFRGNQSLSTTIIQATITVTTTVTTFPSSGTSSQLILSTASTVSSTGSTPPSLQFFVTCNGCTQPTYESHCGSGPPVGINRYWAHDQFAGFYEYYSNFTGRFVVSPLYGNGTQTIPVITEYNTPLHDWWFELVSCQGELQVQLAWTNGTIVWQGVASPSNDTTSYAPPGG